MNNRFEALNKATMHTPVLPDKPDGKVKDYFATDVFTRERMKEYIAEDVLQQLFDGAGWTVDHFAGGYLVGHAVGQYVDQIHPNLKL